MTYPSPAFPHATDGIPTVYHLCGLLPGVNPEMDVAHIYVGVTGQLRGRLRDHSRKWWWVAVRPELCEFVEYRTMEDARRAERELIWLYQPAMNRAGRLMVVGP